MIVTIIMIWMIYSSSGEEQQQCQVRLTGARSDIICAEQLVCWLQEQTEVIGLPRSRCVQDESPTDVGRALVTALVAKFLRTVLPRFSEHLAPTGSFPPRGQRRLVARRWRRGVFPAARLFLSTTFCDKASSNWVHSEPGQKARGLIGATSGQPHASALTFDLGVHSASSVPNGCTSCTPMFRCLLFISVEFRRRTADSTNTRSPPFTARKRMHCRAYCLLARDQEPNGSGSRLEEASVRHVALCDITEG